MLVSCCLVCQVALAQPCVFFVDNAQWVDAESWTFLYDVSCDGSALLVLAMRPFAQSVIAPVAAEKIIHHPHTIQMVRKKFENLHDLLHARIQYCCLISLSLSFCPFLFFICMAFCLFVCLLLFFRWLSCLHIPSYLAFMFARVLACELR